MSFQPSRGDSPNLSDPSLRGCVGYWPMLEGSGTRVYDYSGFQHHGTLEDFTKFEEWGTGPHGVTVQTEQGTPGNSNTIALDSAVELANGPMTFCAHIITPYAGSASQAVVSGGPTASATRIFRQIANIYAYTDANTGALHAGANFQANTPYLLTWQRVSSTVVRLWLDDRLVDDNTVAAGATITFARLCALQGNSSAWSGPYGPVTIWNRVLSESQIRQQWQDPWAAWGRESKALMAPPAAAYDIQGSNATGASDISFGWTVDP